MERSQGAPAIPEADDCFAHARRRRRVHEAANRRNRSLRQAAGGSGSRSAAVFCQRDSVLRYCKPGFGRKPYGASDQNRREPGASGKPRRHRHLYSSRRAGLSNPDRAKTITNRGEITGWGFFLSAAQQAASRQKSRQGAGLRVLTGPATSPSFAQKSWPRCWRFSAGEVASVQSNFPRRRAHGRFRCGTSQRADLPLRQGRRHRRARRRFLACGPGSVRYQKDFADRRRVTDEKKEMNRLYSIESTPTLTGMKADHRLALKADRHEGFARQLAPGHLASSASGSAASAPDRQVAVAISKDLQAHRGRSLVVAGPTSRPRFTRWRAPSTRRSVMLAQQ